MPDPKRIAESIHKLIDDTIHSLALELIDVEYIREGEEWILRITIDKPGGISHDDCRKASLAVEPVIDAKDIIKAHYNLEVSSPGFDRPLISDRDLLRAIGQLIEIHPDGLMATGRQTGRPVEGILQEVTNEEISIILDEPFIKGVRPRTNGQARRFDRKDIKLIRRAIRI